MLVPFVLSDFFGFVFRFISSNSAGINVVLRHDNGYYTVYAHLSKFYVSKDQHVSRGERIGAMGHTGNAFGTHLHFGVFTGPPYNGGRSFNPLRLWQ